MLRFLPDGLLEGLLRPFLMIDPAGYVYVEMMAPDWRLALFLLALAIGAVAGRIKGRISAEQLRLVVGFVVCLYVWTFAIGNGRYFMAWLLIVGPLLVLATRWLPGSATLRWLVLGVGLCVQGFALVTSYTADSWGLARWVRGPGIDIEASPLQTRPAIFLSISSLTYSILVPRFDPRSRWANIAGQVDIRPGTKEYPRLIAMLTSDLPKYVVLPVVAGYPDATQPDPAVHDLIVRSLAPFDLELDGAACETLRSSLAPGPIGQDGKGSTFRGFWFCPITRSAHTAAQPAKPAMQGASQLADVFARVEQRCPRFFPPGGGEERYSDGITLRHYAGSDVSLYIDGTGLVSYKYFRAMNPTSIGTTDQVRQGKFAIACDKLPGRYRLPWQKD